MKTFSTVENVIETVTIDKYTFQIYKRPSNVKHYANKPFAVIYDKATPKGKWSKYSTIEHFVFATYEECEEYVTKLYGAIHKRLKADKKRKEEKAAAQKALNASEFYKVGDIVYNSWGYEQTNISFYQVLKVTAKSIKVVEVSQEMENDSMYDHGMAWNVLAVKDSFLDNAKPFTLRVRPEGRLSTPKNEFGCFSKWDGTPKYKSTYY